MRPQSIANFVGLVGALRLGSSGAAPSSVAVVATPGDSSNPEAAGRGMTSDTATTPRAVNPGKAMRRRGHQSKVDKRTPNNVSNIAASSPDVFAIVLPRVRNSDSFWEQLKLL